MGIRFLQPDAACCGNSLEAKLPHPQMRPLVERSKYPILPNIKYKEKKNGLLHLSLEWPSVLGGSAAPVTKYTGMLNLTMSSLSAHSTKVNINFFGEFESTARGRWDGVSRKLTGEAYSNGSIEKEIIDHLNQQQRHQQLTPFKKI